MYHWRWTGGDTRILGMEFVGWQEETWTRSNEWRVYQLLQRPCKYSFNTHTHTYMYIYIEMKMFLKQHGHFTTIGFVFPLFRQILQNVDRKSTLNLWIVVNRKKCKRFLNNITKMRRSYIQIFIYEGSFQSFQIIPNTRHKVHTQGHIKLIIMIKIQSITNVVSIHNCITSSTHLISHLISNIKHTTGGGHLEIAFAF